MDDVNRDTRLQAALPGDRNQVDEEDQRSPFRRDRDRILYSRAFRRLSGVSQVARVDESYFYHDRLSHSLKTAQVASSLADILVNSREYSDTDIENHIHPHVAEAAALAHDLGHPPFGHAAEEELNRQIPDRFGGFEGNPQSFRIICKSETRRTNSPGLNLTVATCNALLKYPWGQNEMGDYGYSDKWGYYDTEQEYFDVIRKCGYDTGERTIEAQIMDYADDITYAIHDVEDFYRAGLIPFDQLLEGTGERERAIEYIRQEEDISRQEIQTVFQTLKSELLPSDDSTLLTPFRGTDEEISELNQFSSTLIERYLAPFAPADVYVDEDSLKLEYDQNLEREITVLKSLTFFYVIDETSLMSQQRGHRKLIKRLFEVFSNSADPSEDTNNFLPEPYKSRTKNLESHEDRERYRTVVDLITSMTEPQAVELYKRLEGISSGSLREGILR